MILEVSWDDLWTLSFGLSQFHGHGSRLVCEMALILMMCDQACHMDLNRTQKNHVFQRHWTVLNFFIFKDFSTLNSPMRNHLKNQALILYFHDHLFIFCVTYQA
jgi:hypothetical protein